MATQYVPTVSGGLTGYMTYDDNGVFTGFIREDQKGTALDVAADTLSTRMPKNRLPKPIVDPALEAQRIAVDQLDTQNRIAKQTAAAEVARGIFSGSRGKEDSERLIFALNNNLDPTQRFMPEFDKLFYASKNPTVVDSGTGDLTKITTTSIPALTTGNVADTSGNTKLTQLDYIEPITRAALLNANLNDPKLTSQIAWSQAQDAAMIQSGNGLSPEQVKVAQQQAASLAGGSANVTKASADTVIKLGGTGTVADNTKLNTQGGTPALTTGDLNKIATTSTPALTTGDINKITTSPAATSPPSTINTGSIPALTTADLTNWYKTQPQGITADQLKTTLDAQQVANTKAYSDALQANQTALTSQNANFLKDWNTSADALKTNILSGVDTKNQAFGTQATQGFMDAFKNFQIPTNQQTGVNMGNYNDNRNAAADQWWSQYVTGRR
jgi:hypothetical protein